MAEMSVISMVDGLVCLKVVLKAVSMVFSWVDEKVV